MGKVSAVLLSWRRPENIPVIAERILSMLWVAELIVWDNDDERPLQWQPSDERARVVPAGRNYVTYGRFLAAKIAEHDAIYTQDDDVLVSTETLDELYSNYARSPSQRSELHMALAPGHYRYMVGRKPWGLLGWGAIFYRDTLRVLDRYIEAYGEDDVLVRKADRIFSMLVGRENFRPIEATYRRMANDAASFSLYRRQDHHRLTREAVARCNCLRNEHA